MSETTFTTPSNGDLSSRVTSLERQVMILLIALIFVSGTLGVFFYRQAANLNKDYEAVAPQARQVLEVYGKNQQGIQRLITSLVQYSQTHKDIVPLLEHNGVLAPNGAPAIKK